MIVRMFTPAEYGLADVDQALEDAMTEHEDAIGVYDVTPDDDPRIEAIVDLMLCTASWFTTVRLVSSVHDS